MDQESSQAYFVYHNICKGRYPGRQSEISKLLR